MEYNFRERVMTELGENKGLDPEIVNDVVVWAYKDLIKQTQNNSCLEISGLCDIVLIKKAALSFCKINEFKITKKEEVDEIIRRVAVFDTQRPKKSKTGVRGDDKLNNYIALEREREG